MWKILYKIFLHYMDIAIFALGYFILPHPVYCCTVTKLQTSVQGYKFKNCTSPGRGKQSIGSAITQQCIV